MIESSKPRKQRKFRMEAPLHARRHFVNVHMGKELKAKLKTRRRSLPVRKGDKVKVLVGEHRKHVGKITGVDLQSSKVFIEGIIAKKAKGTEVPKAMEPSNLVLVDVDMKDKKRAVVLERSAKIG